MLIKHKLLNGIDYLYFDNICDYIIIGLYRNNSVLFENNTDYGINYVIDSLFYNLLADEFGEFSEIYSHTYFSYSEFILKCPVQKLSYIFEKIKKIFEDFSIDGQYFDLIKNQTYSKIEDFILSIDDVFDEFYYENKRFSHSICGTRESIKSLTDTKICDYMYPIFDISKYNICISVPKHSYYTKESGKRKIQNKTLLKLPKNYNLRTDADVVLEYKKWDFFDLIIAFDCNEILLDNLFIIELLCKIIENNIYSFSRTLDIEKPKLHLDYGVPRIVFKFSTDKNELFKFLDFFFKTLLLPLETDLLIKERIIKNYEQMIRDPVSMNNFLGWNYSIDEMYDINLFTNGSYKEIISNITSSEIQKIQKSIFKKSNLSLMIAGPITKRERILESIEGWFA